MNTVFSRAIGTIGLLSMSAAALAAETKPATPQEPIGFVTGGVIGGFAAGPVGAVIGAGLGTWLGNRVHRASDATKAEATVAVLQTDKSQLQGEKSALLTEKRRAGRNQSQLERAARRNDRPGARARKAPRRTAARFWMGCRAMCCSARAAPRSRRKSRIRSRCWRRRSPSLPQLKVRVDGYADPRGTVDANLKLSEERANAVRDLFLAAGISNEVLEVNAYGKSQSVAADSDGYALERRVRLTLQAQGAAAVAQVDEKE